MKSEQEVGLWRMVFGAVGVTALGLGISLNLEAASRPEQGPAADNASSAATHVAATPLVKPAAANRGPRRAPIGANTRVSVGRLPSSGYRVVNVVTVDWRNDRGKLARDAGRLYGGLPLPNQLGGPAAGGCTFDVDCDDADKCTVDACEIALASPPGSGKCEYNPVANGAPGECDDGVFCNGKETCQGAVCAPGSFRNVGAPCNSNDDCRQPGVCNTTTRQCISGDTGPCASNDDCGFPGTGTCNPGTCTSGLAALCCSDPDNPTICAEYLPRCSANSSAAGAACQTNADCPGGACERCQPSCTNDTDCADGRRCNGTETCQRTCVGGVANGQLCPPSTCPGGSCLGQCHPGKNPCGASAVCVERRCQNVSPTQYCLYDFDCPTGSVCEDITPNPPGIVCFPGRCCSPATEPVCTKAPLSSCNIPPSSQWYAGDDGQQHPAEGCGGEDPLSYEEWGCPKYGGGLSQHDAGNPPVYPVTVGPISDSPVPVPLPMGPGTPLNALGDDYTVTNASYISLDVMRFVGGLLTDGAISIDFYDTNGTFVEDALLTSLNAGIGIQVVVFNPSLVIPPTGYVVMQVARDLAPNTKFVWSSTTNANGMGTNDANKIWVNGGPTSGPGNFLKMCVSGSKANQACATNADCPGSVCAPAPGILAFELVGDKVPTPAGACCEANGDCTDGVVSWVCVAQGNSYLGDNQRCAGCNGGTNAGGSCRICVGGGPAGLCTSDAACSPGTCEPNTARCRTCLGGSAQPGTPCTSNAQCPGGGTCPALASTCTTGLVGQTCTTNAQCDLVGFCDLNTLTCIFGNVGQTCTADAQCDVAGTCAPVACQPLAACARGACCQTDPLICNPQDPGACCSLQPDEATCNATGGAWQGYGTECDADSGDEGPQQHCCRIPQYADLRCMSGPNNLQSCTEDTNCRFCVGGGHAGETCTTTSAAEPEGCLDEGHCIGNVCVGGSPPTPNTCTVDAQCPDNSGVCRGRCVIRGTGGDNCEDALVQFITMPVPGEDPKTITISGSNLAATSTQEEPDGCFSPMTMANDDPGWFEAFAISQCAHVRIDFCCSDPIRQPAYTILFPDCTCQDPIPSAPDPYVFGQADAGQGPPYCDEDNIWFTFPMLPAGTYYYPVFSALAGAHGDYQMHVTVQACPTAACCYNACSGGPNFGNHCDKNATCPGGVCQGGGNPGASCTEHAFCIGGGTCSVTCVSQCTEVVKSECDALIGYFLGPPNITPAWPLCLGNPCETGSCCTGPGQCLDQVSEFDPTPMTAAICDEPAFNGNFIGGVRCTGGYCVGGTDDGENCSDYPPGQCAAPGVCVGTAQQLAQPNPCPVCEIQGSSNCQAWDNSPQMSPSDLSAESEHVWADDFMLTAGGNLTDVCVWGTYVETDRTTLGVDCGGPEAPDDQRPDNFRVRVYEDVNGAPGGGNCTNAPFQRCFLNSDCNSGGTCLLAPVGESTCTRTKAVIPGAASEGAVWGGKTWSFQLSLDNPITGLVAGKCYWLEVTNNTPDAVYGEKCTWHWSQLAANSTQGNLYSAAGSATNGYGTGSQRAWDMTWCLNLDAAPGGCAAPWRACCSCLDVCLTTSLIDCEDANGVWHDDVEACGGYECAAPPNDNCAGAEEVPVGLYAVSTHCATTDGVNDVGGRANTTAQQDVWYFYRPTEDCPLRVDGCTSSQNVFDSVIAVYHDANDPTRCMCPLTQAANDRTLIDASNDDCVTLGAETGGVVEVDALAGHCYTIRFAGVSGNHQAGRSAVQISCGPPICGDRRRNGTEQCDGLDNENCRTATPSTLCNANCTCGAPNLCGNGVIDAGEECDPNRFPPDCGVESICLPAGNAKQCTCTPHCGNNHIEAGEECDGTECDSNSVTPNAACTTDAQCQDATHLRGRCRDAACPGLCRTGENPPFCQCPPMVCGNGRLEEPSGEECEFGLCVGGNNAGQGCESDVFCAPGGGTCDETADRFDCWAGDCRLPGDPLGGCRCGCPAIVAPDAPAADPSGVRQNRYISFIPGNAGMVTAIRVKLADLQNTVPPLPPRNFSAFEGQYRWVGPPTDSPDEPPVGVTFKAAALQCGPYYQDWGSVGLLRVFGSEIVPDSLYEVQAIALGRDPGDEGAYSAALSVNTARFGDVAATFNPPGPSDQPDAIDISRVVDKWRGSVGAPGKWQIQLGPNVPDPTKRVDTVDIALAVDAFKRVAYSLRGPVMCPYSPSCPDGVVDRNEECDDGNFVNGDGCNTSCRAEARTAAVSLVPVLPYGTDAEPYIPGTVIQGNNIFLPLGGERVWLELKLSGWDPDLNGTPRLETWQVQIDADGFVSGEMGTLALAVQPCTVAADCTAAFGPGSQCGVQTPGRCAAGFQDNGHPGGPNLGTGSDLSMPDFRFGAAASTPVLDPGTLVYAATMVLDTPEEAQGRFTIGFDPSLLNTYMFGSPGRVPIPLTLQPAVITVVGKNRFLTVSRSPTVPGNPGGPMTALRVRMIDLQHPIPANLPANPPKNFTAFDATLNGVCEGGSVAGHHCDTNADCRVCSVLSGVAGLPCTSNADCRRCVEDSRIVCSGNADCVSVGGNCGIAGNCPAIGGTCSGLTACTAVGECLEPPGSCSGQGNCARWVGKPATFLESQDLPGLGDFVAARLQCTPYYRDWSTVGRFHVTGAEILPSSVYDLEALASTCMGNENTCPDVSDPVRLFTARSADITPPFNPPSTKVQPDAADVLQLVNKLKSLSGAPIKAITQLQPNLPELNADVNALDIVAVVDSGRQFAYPFGGPCPCPSPATCGVPECAGATVCTGSALPGLGAGALCVKTCRSGSNVGDPCVNHSHCPGGFCGEVLKCSGGANAGLVCVNDADCPSSTCGRGYCRDRCGRCSP